MLSPARDASFWDTETRSLPQLDGSTVVARWPVLERADPGREVLIPRGEEVEEQLEAQHIFSVN